MITYKGGVGIVYQTVPD